MIRTVFSFFLFLFLIQNSYCQYFIVEDFTKEHLFTTNIEGPNFDKHGNLYVVNYKKDGSIGLVKADGSCELFLELPENSVANAIQFNKKGNMFLADFKGHNILEVDMKTKKITIYCHNKDFNQPNDIAINKNGQLYASDPNWKESTGKLWRIDKGGKAILLEEKMGTTNGIELSPDEKILYVNESVQRKVWKYDLDKKGNIFNKILFFQFHDFGLDGMKCDSVGNLYIARHGKGAIDVYSKDGKLIREIFLKGKSVSNLTFGGLNKSTIYTTLQDRGCMEKFNNDIKGK